MGDENPLMKRFEQAFKDEQFTYFQIIGFQTKPELAFIAGAAVGYRMGAEDFTESLDATATPPDNQSKDGER